MKPIRAVGRNLAETQIAVGAVVKHFGVSVLIILVTDDEEVGPNQSDACVTDKFLFS